MEPVTRWRRGDVVVTWLGGGLLIDHPAGSVLVDPAPGVAAALGDLITTNDIAVVVLCADRLRSVGGLLEVCAWCPPSARVLADGLMVVHPMDVDRAGLLAETWQRGWPEGVPVQTDAVFPGTEIDLGHATVAFHPLSAVETVRAYAPGASQGLLPVRAYAVRLDIGGLTIAWVPDATKVRDVQRATAGVDLAVVEVGAGGNARRLAAVHGTARAGRPRTLLDEMTQALDADTIWVVWPGMPQVDTHDDLN